MTPQPLKILAGPESARRIEVELTRRGFLAAGTAAGAGVLLTACGPGGAATESPEATGGPLEDKLVIYTWGAYDDPEVLEDFTAELGPQIQIDAFSSNEELVSKLIAAAGTGGYDIVVPSDRFVPQMVENGLLQKLNRDLLPNFEHLDPAFTDLPWDPGSEYALSKAWGMTGYVYDTKHIQRELTSWDDFLDAAKNEASGQTSILDSPPQLTGLYFWTHGIDQNTTDQADFDACEEFLIAELAPHIGAFDSNPGGQMIPQFSQMLVQVWNGDARQGMLNASEQDRWKFVFPTPTSMIWMDTWAIPVGAPHPEAAHAFINYVLDPEVSLKELAYIGYHTGVAGIEEAANAAGLPMLDLVFFSEDQIATLEPNEINEGHERVVAIWSAVKAAAGQ